MYVAVEFYAGAQVAPDGLRQFRFEFEPRRLAAVAAVVGGLILLAAGCKIIALKSGGGDGVARALGCRLVERETANPAEKRLINIVDEMALAAGAQPPAVYLSPDPQTINAFAAGFDESDAVIGVTEGALSALSRDELQGVIAHEFSHILHGDMRLNMRLMGVVFGVAALGYIGHSILRNALFFGLARRGGGRGALAFAAVGGGLAVLGFVGVLGGNLIRAAISRQREYLADASAVQYTRNPQGIGGALVKLASTGGVIASPKAVECGHLLFEDGLARGFFNPFATHPPIRKRIKKVLPQWDGELPAPASAPATTAADSAPTAPATHAPAAAGFAAAGFSAAAGFHVDGDSAAARVGQNDPDARAHARRFLRELNPQIAAAASNPFGARAVVYALLLDRKNAACRASQIDHLRRAADPAVFALLETIEPAVAAASPANRLPLVDLCLSSLRRLSPAQAAVFESNLAVLIEADEAIELFEWCAQTLAIARVSPRRPRFAKQPFAAAAAVALSMLARAGGEADARAAYDRALRDWDKKPGFCGAPFHPDSLRAAFFLCARPTRGANARSSKPPPNASPATAAPASKASNCCAFSPRFSAVRCRFSNKPWRATAGRRRRRFSSRLRARSRAHATKSIFRISPLTLITRSITPAPRTKIICAAPILSPPRRARFFWG